ncbi:acyltransferase [Asticcacaulis sp. EMRT-3]|uniref:acyltransferase family protein n=1 Tax=Asticcacaulis sp. EMRT-3 TaxID=3040349 RepID=UPI0024AE88AA|nr:acyltransferase [Asticcacaulis sp. EMRT-3]MDI7776226.1 acyltransferase [Asticcacaulis sp. EMRT-3]
MPQDHLKPLTSLRFFAATWVVLYTYIHELKGAFDIGVFDKGYLGVDLFFILSGFILSYVYLEAFGERRFTYGQFIVHRLARIYPLHIATLGFTLLLIAAAALKGLHLDPNADNWAALPAHLFLVQAWGLAPTASFNHPSWSISAEWFAYLTFPVTAMLAIALRKRPMVAVGLAMGFMAVIYTVFQAISGFPLTEATFQWGALRIVPCFLYGSALFLAWRAGAVARPRVALAGAVIASLTVIFAASFAPSDLLIVLALGLLVLSLAGLAPKPGESGLLSSRVLIYLGEISFATYMIYVPWKWVYLKGVDRLLGLEGHGLPFVWWLAGLLALVPLSMLAHHLVERPCRKIVRYYGEKWLKSGTYAKVNRVNFLHQPHEKRFEN